MAIDSKLVERIAKLSRISLTDAEIHNLSSELDNILNWIEQLSELDTDGISPVFSFMTGSCPFDFRYEQYSCVLLSCQTIPG